jgi:hypothetical protein
MGEIRLRADLAEAGVFIDDGLPGKAKNLKTLRLDPGVYNLEGESG